MQSVDFVKSPSCNSRGIVLNSYCIYPKEVLFMKRAVTIQDLSCFGKCSVTVALPLISAMGVECAVIPTAVLSTHTGGFTGWTFRDLSEDIPKIAAHWKTQGLKFDGVYTGYLGSPEQAQMIEDFIDEFKPGLIFVDPAMADNGKLYPGFTPEFALEMGKLCGKADVIVPNLTEACFMLGLPYPGGKPMDELAREMRCSPNTVLARFRSFTGLPPQSFLMKCRIRRAEDLLQDPSRRVTDIAETLGFASSQHFATRFKQETGRTPRAFRQDVH